MGCHLRSGIVVVAVEVVVAVAVVVVVASTRSSTSSSRKGQNVCLEMLQTVGKSSKIEQVMTSRGQRQVKTLKDSATWSTYHYGQGVPERK